VRFSLKKRDSDRCRIWNSSYFKIVAIILSTNANCGYWYPSKVPVIVSRTSGKQSYALQDGFVSITWICHCM